MSVDGEKDGTEQLLWRQGHGPGGPGRAQHSAFVPRRVRNRDKRTYPSRTPPCHPSSSTQPTSPRLRGFRSGFHDHDPHLHLLLAASPGWLCLTNQHYDDGTFTTGTYPIHRKERSGGSGRIGASAFWRRGKERRRSGATDDSTARFVRFRFGFGRRYTLSLPLSRLSFSLQGLFFRPEPTRHTRPYRLCSWRTWGTKVSRPRPRLRAEDRKGAGSGSGLDLWRGDLYLLRTGSSLGLGALQRRPPALWTFLSRLAEQHTKALGHDIAAIRLCVLELEFPRLASAAMGLHHASLVEEDRLAIRDTVQTNA